MSGQALQAELTSLAQEAKRKNPEIRTDLKSLPSTSEQQLAADLSRRPSFIDPLLLACNTRNAKYAGSATVCLQRLVIIRGLPKSRLKDVLDAFNACTSLGLDIQLKVLQALPALAQNYADDLKGDHLAAALQVCAALQNVKAVTVSGVAAATLQQLVVSVFDRVAAEDEGGDKFPIVTRISGGDGPIALREAAYDAYRVFLDICFATEGQNTRFVRFSALSATSGLELMGACLGSHTKIFASHPEQTNILRTVVMPHLIRVISERQAFGVTLRALRVASFVIRHHLQAMPDECEVVLGLLTHMIDSEATTWKRAMCMEVFRLVYTESGLAVQIYLQYDAKEGKRAIIRDNIACFVKISTEKPSVIGLGQHSSIPTEQTRDTIAEQVAMEAAGGVAGVIAPSPAVGDANVPGISTRWSAPKTQCMDQLDKTDPPILPETYVYSLVLECLNGLSENLAKVVLPLTVQHDASRLRRDQEPESDDEVESDEEHATSPKKTRNRKKRSQSYRSRTVPLNPLSADEGSEAARIRAIANLVEECWPALLATYSTFLNASLDNNYYRALIRSYQRFLQVSGLLRLSTARDAFLTTLGKAAVPPSIVTSSISTLSSPTAETPGIYSNGKGLLSVESFTTQISGSEKSRRPSYDPSSKPTLSTRNLLCLRALLNVAIAIGPTLDSSFNIVFETLLQAGVVLNASGAKSTGIGPEIAAVEGAVLRLLESTADYPNDAFLHVLTTLCRLLNGRSEGVLSSPIQTKPSGVARKLSGLSGITTDIALSTQDYVFVLTRLRDLAEHNVARFASYTSSESGWVLLVDSLVDLSIATSTPDDARRLSADILARCSMAVAEASTSEEPDDAGVAQQMVLSSLHLLVRRIYEQSGDLTNIDIENHNRILDSVKAILEKSGEALTAGWDIILAIIGSVFDMDDVEEEERGEHNTKEGWLKLSSHFVAPYLGRSAFSVMQLVCSDFLAPLPQTCLSPLVEILFRFASQSSDLNISLTAITLFWDVSDFLVKQEVVSGLNELISGITEERLVLGHERIVTRSKESRPAQWVLLMYRLTDVIADDRSEVRNSAFQTLLRIFKNHSGDFSDLAWQLTIETLLFKLLREHAEKQRALRSGKTSSDVIIGLDATSSEIIGDIAALLAGQFDQMASFSSFDRLWSDLMEIFETLLTFRSSAINAAVYNALGTLLGAFGADNKKLGPAISRTELLWSSSIPDNSADVKGQAAGQDQYIAYINCGRTIYNLVERSTTTERLNIMVQNMIACVKSSTGGAYSSDVQTPTALQQKVLEHLRALHGNIDLVSSTLVFAASQLMSLPFESSEQRPRRNLTFVALSKSSMDWIVELITSPLSKPEMFYSGAVAKSLEDIVIPMRLKYRWTQSGRAPALWQKATSASLTIIEKTLKQMEELDVPSELKTRIWTAIVNIAHASMHADIDEASPQPTLEAVETDEFFDCESMKRLKSMMTSALGSPSIPDEIRQTYSTSLFNASLIHAVERGDISQRDDKLANLYDLRIGRVRDPEPSPREDMAYLCFAELVSLVAESSESQVKPSQTAAMHLVLRFALPLKAYIVDQPLRGSMPQPLSQVEELLFCLTEVEKLRCAPDAMDRMFGIGSQGPKAHLQLLYPLVVKAVGVAGDKRYGNKKILAMLERVLVASR
ncbi:hypothetical protein E4T38_05807 [Aureobasidium subglaciale]|nr:hypothetical protein E4T38_05807 [Aureobasidium subglaciale]KAI5220804.1 hypothetical protein E4T40_05738 [Aureobasidium subglaciale]KAI5224649.1 hypothetical protein E4T41_05604 [Aureobasidium subglaciale]KAI5260897.1 hypothetical protein E4T46_05561 [Aureobasidium subglaciale]